MTTPRPLALGILTHVRCYPVKSLRGEELGDVYVQPDGLDGDRRRALILTTPDRPRSGKTYRGKEDQRLHLLDEPAEAQRAARERGLDLEIAPLGRYFDDAPVSLLVDRWVEDLERLLGRHLDPRRFRPNLFIESAPDVPREADLVGSMLQIGPVVLRVVAATVRCVTPTYDVETGEADPEVLRVLAQHRDATMGVYCAVERPGVVARGATALVFPRELAPA